MNYDPIHDTYSQSSSVNGLSVGSLAAAPAVTTNAGAVNGRNNATLPINNLSDPILTRSMASNAKPEPREPVYPDADPQVQSQSTQLSEKLVDRAKVNPGSPVSSSAHQGQSENAKANSATGAHSIKEAGDKLSINNLLGDASRAQARSLASEQSAEAVSHEDDDEEEDDDDEDDDDDDEDEDGDDDRDIHQIESHEKTPGELPPNFRSFSKGFKHLKKADGEPFWRKDIQYDFLDALFNDENRVFTNQFPFCLVPNAANGPKLTFSELYIRTLAESPKSSRVLRERLIKDKEMGISVSKVCLLVNAGRMNTTVNFVPDMRSALRTYHLIPSLQATREGPSKPLQDTPRLKTILKAVCDGQGHLHTLLDLLRCPVSEKPNTNVIKLIFLMSSFFQNIPYHHDEFTGNETILEQLRFVKATLGPQNKFLEFFLSDNIYPKNRARRFLWLLYTYLETSFSPEDLEKNPFNPKVIPPVEYIRKEELTLFDNDEDFEVDYAAKMYHTRMMHLDEEINNMNPKRGNKSKVERQRIRKQLILDHHYRPLSDKKQEDLADDLSIGDDSIQHDDNEVSFNEAADENGRPGYLQKFASALKRKRPTPSVGALVDFSRKDNSVNMKWANPTFPVKNLEVIRQKFLPCTRSIRVPSLTKESETSVSRKMNGIQKSQHIVDIVFNKSTEFDKVRKNVLNTLNQQFAKQLARGNGLLAMEWDRIRSEISSGIEAYLYQQFGKSLATHIIDKDKAAEQLLFRNADFLRKENFMSGTEKLVGDSSPIDIGLINKYGIDFTPIERFNNAGERSNFELVLILKLLEEQQEKIKHEAPKRRRIRFDLSADDMSYN